jgi:hypothetical protein
MSKIFTFIYSLNSLDKSNNYLISANDHDLERWCDEYSTELSIFDKIEYEINPLVIDHLREIVKSS